MSHVEARSFRWDTPDARLFFEEHGYVIVHGVLADEDLRHIDDGWGEVVSEAAARVELSPEDFIERFPQNRDLWRKNDLFRSLLLETNQSAAMRHFLGTTGVRLFHDQAICKPRDRSDTIPWHQDSAYWPFDRVGASIWTPTTDVAANGGCLKVLDGSHRDGAGAPQDFLSARRAEHDQDERVVHVPVRRGQSVVIDGLTWHGSDPNVGDRDRLAYLTLWVPASACFVPEHASWHPSSKHIDVSPGERLAGEYFPLFGTEAEVTSTDRLVTFPSPLRGDGPSMFTASKDIAIQLAWLHGVGGPRPLADQIATSESRGRIVARLIELKIIGPADAHDAASLLCDLHRQELVRRNSVARDVYLRAVSRWWALVGAKIEQLQAVP